MSTNHLTLILKSSVLRKDCCRWRRGDMVWTWYGYGMNMVWIWYEEEMICRWTRGNMVWRRGDMVCYGMKGDVLKFKGSAHFEHWHFNCTMNRPTVTSFHCRHHFNIFLKTLLKKCFIFWKCVQEQQVFPSLISSHTIFPRW